MSVAPETHAAGLRHAGHSFGRSLAFLAALCLAIAVLLTAMDGGGFRYKIVYSFAIGFSCWGMTDALRMSLVLFINRRRAVQGATGQPPFTIGWRGMLPMLLLATLLGPPIGLAIGDALTGLKSESLQRWDSPSTRVTMTLALIGSLAALFAMTLVERLTVSRAEAEAARRLAAESQLKLLEAQLEPHMLFNTLANLRVLIALDATQAQAMLDRLIAFLRATLSASRQSQHSLEAEFQRITDYLALMAFRMGPRLAVQLDLPAELKQAAMPPLLLQPLVENSIRHGLEPKVAAGRIEVRAWRDGAQLHLSVRDSGVGLSGAAAATGSGFGLEQVRARLATLYGERASLELSPADAPEGGTEARIRLPYSTLPPNPP